ncbi:MAG: hypothetical protein NT068_01410 [Candidatus Nomurabacteria bacterium]|nr:hypothetical protein [Candidatus Nomurabacteria bacterium]
MKKRVLVIGLVCAQHLVSAQKKSVNMFVPVVHQQVPAKGSLNYLKLEAQKSYSLFKRDSILYDSICSEKKQIKNQIADAKMFQEIDKLATLHRSYMSTCLAKKEIHRKVKNSVKVANADLKKLDKEMTKYDSFTLAGVFRKFKNS